MATVATMNRESDAGEHLPNIAVGRELIMKVTEACALSDRQLRDDELIEYTGATGRAAKEVIKAALWMGLIELRDEMYLSPSNVRSEFPAGDERQALIFHKYLQRKKSFVQFATFLDYGNDPSVAAEKVRVLYQTDVSASIVLQLFGSWGRSAGILEGSNRLLRLKPEYHAPDLPTEYLEGLKDALENDMKARVFVARKLTDDAFRTIPEAGVERAVRAIRGIGTDPRNSVEDAAELFEDYLRLKAGNDMVATTDASGIGGVIKALGNKLTIEHKSIADALNTLRIMSAHPTRATTGLRWQIRADSGLEAVLLILSLIRSINEYDRTKATIF